MEELEGDVKRRLRLQIAAKLEHYCAYQERCHSEVFDKLEKIAPDYDEKEWLISHLKEHSFLNELRFAKIFAFSKWKIKRWGRLKINHQLKLKKVPASYREIGLKEIDEDDYLAGLEELALKKLSLTPSNDNPLVPLKKVHNFLTSKGYENYLIQACVRKITGNI
ncbi:RecX family transcriptional regulator [Chitinophagales bacterium]|nr:RecX family transcriptional regulator [Chitinophagales bacterium]